MHSPLELAPKVNHDGRVVYHRPNRRHGVLRVAVLAIVRDGQTVANPPASTAVELVKAFNPQVFHSIEEVGFVEKGVFPLQRNCRGMSLKRFLRPLRKGK